MPKPKPSCAKSGNDRGGESEQSKIPASKGDDRVEARPKVQFWPTTTFRLPWLSSNQSQADGAANSSALIPSADESVPAVFAADRKSSADDRPSTVDQQPAKSLRLDPGCVWGAFMLGHHSRTLRMWQQLAFEPGCTPGSFVSNVSGTSMEMGEALVALEGWIASGVLRDFRRLANYYDWFNDYPLGGVHATNPSRTESGRPKEPW